MKSKRERMTSDRGQKADTLTNNLQRSQSTFSWRAQSGLPISFLIRTEDTKSIFQGQSNAANLVGKICMSMCDTTWLMGKDPADNGPVFFLLHCSRKVIWGGIDTWAG